MKLCVIIKVKNKCSPLLNVNMCTCMHLPSSTVLLINLQTELNDTALLMTKSS